MSMMDNGDKQPSVMHYCKICNRGFGCGGALGGHMRAHAMGDVNTRMYEHPISSFRDKPDGNHRHSYFLRAREDSGKKSSTWPLTEHGKCTLLVDRASPISSPAGSEDHLLRLNHRSGKEYIWIEERKLKQAKLPENSETCDSSEEEDLANCLVMLSNKTFDSSIKEETKANETAKGTFQCKACKKVFNSHQALGGHRASHKTVKGCFASRFDNLNDEQGFITITNDHDQYFTPIKSVTAPSLDLNHPAQYPFATMSKRKTKVHECSICHRVFSSGQALGGHKRCHWHSSTVPESSFNGIFQYERQQPWKKPMFRKSQPLDLNLPPLLDDTDEADRNGDNRTKSEARTRIFLQPLVNKEVDDNQKIQNYKLQKIENMHGSLHYLNGGEHGEINLGKLSDLRDMNVDGSSSSPWLQVGIASTTDQGLPHEVATTVNFF
ncbi:unnamed protein product [Ilex paraguariensis]|uniref:C2H2-type domain-containing protein n=1 Tax=Ilex paraguariensis TaxID=185542 RepID=A0ABC8ULJ4_9AQUA